MQQSTGASEGRRVATAEVGQHQPATAAFLVHIRELVAPPTCFGFPTATSCPPEFVGEPPQSGQPDGRNDHEEEDEEIRTEGVDVTYRAGGRSGQVFYDRQFILTTAAP